jgi:hypothetical protein
VDDGTHREGADPVTVHPRLRSLQRRRVSASFLAPSTGQYNTCVHSFAVALGLGKRVDSISMGLPKEGKTFTNRREREGGEREVGKGEGGRARGKGD